MLETLITVILGAIASYFVLVFVVTFLVTAYGLYFVWRICK